MFIAGSYLLATLVVSIEVAQLDVEDGGLQLVDARVTPCIVVHIFLMAAIVAQGADHLSQFIVISRHGTGIAQCTKVFAWVERVASSIAKTACLSMRQNRIARTAMSLRVVLDEFQAMLPAYLPYPIGIGTATIEVDYHDGTSMRSNSLFYECIIDLERIDIGFDKDRHKVIFRNREYAGNIRIGRHDNLVAILHGTQFLVCTQYQRQCIQSVATTNAVFSTNILGIVLFKTLRSITT